MEINLPLNRFSHTLKLVLLVIGLSLVESNAVAQNYIPQNLIISKDTTFCDPDSFTLIGNGQGCSYFVDSIPFSPRSVGGTSMTMFDDQVQGPFGIGFTFNYFCNAYTQFYVCSNGWIGFTAGQTTTWVVQSIPSAAFNVPKNVIMGPWRDWNPAVFGGPYITRQLQGTAPNRRMVVTWSSVPMFSCTSTYGTFQIVINESTGIIENHLTTVPVCTGWGNGDGTQGLHNLAGNTGIVVAGRNDNQFTATNESWLFVPPNLQWIYENDTVAEGSTLNISPTSGVYPDTCQYIYAVLDSGNGNIAIDSVFLSPFCQFPVLTAKDIDCTNDSTGYIVATDTSSITQSPWQFIWTDSVGDTIANIISNNPVDTLSGLPIGDYSVTIKDASGCYIMYGDTFLQEPDTMGLFGTSIDVLCNGDETGTAIAIDSNNYAGLAFGGVYNYYWENSSGGTIQTTLSSNDPTDTLAGVSAGTYNVTIDGCFVQVGTITVNEPPILTASINNATATSCPGVTSCDASGLAVGNGGVTPYSYLWSTGEQTQLATQLCPDTNYVTITDINGCDTVAFVEIAVPDSIITFGDGDTLICITNPANIIATSTGGTPPFSYVWRRNKLNGPLVGNNQVETVFPSLTTKYFVSSTDGNGCPGDTASVVVKVRPPLGIEWPYIDTICPYDTISIVPTGLGGDSIYTYSWSTGVFGDSIMVSPDEPSWYFVTLSDACGTPSHEDSVFVQVGGYSKIVADIKLEADSICVGKNVSIIASGREGHKGPDEYRFAWNQNWDGNRVQFDSPNKTTTYVVTITDLCLSPAGVAEATVYVGNYEMPKFSASPEVSCAEEEIIFSIPENKEFYRYNWILGDGSAEYNVQTDSFTHTYTAPGCYDVTLQVTTNFGCYSEKTERCKVQILESPKANFDYTPINPTTTDPILTLRDRSSGALNKWWYFDTNLLSTEDLFKWELTDTGAYALKLIVSNNDGCVDSITKIIFLDTETTFYIPTSFTPNDDGVNDIFKVVGEGISDVGFSLIIFDRWGGEIYSTKNRTNGWDGRMKNGERAPIGIYPYVVRYVDRFDDEKLIKGQVVVSKNGTFKPLR